MENKPYFVKEEMVLSSMDVKEYDDCDMATGRILKKSIALFEGDGHSLKYRIYMVRDHDKFFKIKFEILERNSLDEYGANVTFAIPSAGLIVKSNEVLFGGHQAASDTHKIFNDRGLVKLFQWKWKQVYDAEKKWLDADGILKIEVQALIFKKAYHRWSWSPLANILWQRDDTDFAIVAVNPGESKAEFKVHKLIIGARSPVFYAMLQSDMKEVREGRVEISDFKADVVRAAVEHFYDRGNMDGEEAETLVGLLVFADKYDVGDLKIKVEYACKFRIFPDTVCAIANAAALLSNSKLLCVCTNAINVYLLNSVPISDVLLIAPEVVAVLEESRKSLQVVTENFLKQLKLF